MREIGVIYNRMDGEADVSLLTAMTDWCGRPHMANPILILIIREKYYDK